MTTKRVLFVDDDENVLAGIQRMLRRQRTEWEMFFVDSGELALELMAKDPMDVVVTDVKMPGMQGHELLEQVAKLHPGCARLILSGHADQEASAQAVRFAHQCLSKPCDADTLRETILHTLRVQELIQNPRIRNALGDICNLPALPRLYQELNAAIESETTDAKTIAAIFARDMALSAKLLQLVNSSFFGLGRRVSSIAEAVMLLGCQRLRALVLSAHVFEMFVAGNGRCGISVEKLGKDALATATLARAISLAERQGGDRPDQAYMGGLLHNLGMLLFASRMPKKFQLVLDKMSMSEQPAHDLEHEILGATHAEAGAYILGLWGLPSRITEAVLLQHTPNVLSYEGFCGVSAVHAAVALTAELDEPIGRSFAHELDLAYLQRLGLVEHIPHWRRLAQDIRAQTSGRQEQ